MRCKMQDITPYLHIQEALDLLREKVDVFLIDIGLPDGNGIELYQELQMEKRIPAIF